MKHLLCRTVSAISLTIWLTGCETLPPTEAAVPTPLPEIPEGGERWICKPDTSSYSSTTTENVVLISPPAKYNLLFIAEIHFGGTTHKGRFSLTGLNRRWNWSPSPDNSAFLDSFTIEANGRGAYFDFRLADDNGRVKPSSLFDCQRR